MDNRLTWHEKDHAFTNEEDKAENEMIDRGPQLPEDYSGEPEEFVMELV